MPSAPANSAMAKLNPYVPPLPPFVDLTEPSRPIPPSTEDASAVPNHAVAKADADNTKANEDADLFASMVAAAKCWAKGKDDPKEERKKAHVTEVEVTKEAQELIDLFQAPNGLVEVTVPSGKNFMLHIDVLAEKCEYFRAALIGNFRETSTKNLTLLDVSDNTFGFFLKWLYGGSLKPEPNANRCNLHSECNLTLPGLFDLWFFADYLCAPVLQNHVVTNIVEKFGNFLNHSNDERLGQVSDSIKMLWKQKGRTERGELAKPLRDLVLSFVANPQYMAKAKAEKLIKAAPAYFLREYALATVERNLSIEAKTGITAATLMAPSVYGFDQEDFFDSKYESTHENRDMAMVCLGQLRGVWAIEPEKYFVKETKRGQEKK